MRFQSKMILAYAVFAFSIALAVGIGFYKYNIKQYKENEINNLKIISNQLENQFEENVKTMKLVTNYILSDIDVVNSIRMLASIEHQKDGNIYLIEARATIQKQLNTDYISKNFYRVVFFNRFGDTIASVSGNTKAVLNGKVLNEIDWLPKASGLGGDFVLIGPHKDDWGMNTKPKVYSVVKELQGKDLGYIEVQKEVSGLEELLTVPKKEIGVAVILNNNELLFSNIKNGDIKKYISIAEKKENMTQESHNPVFNRNEIISASYSPVADATVLIVEDMALVEKGYVSIILFTILIVGCFFIISMAFVIIISRRLTKPIHELRTFMEHTQIENMDKTFRLEMPNDEIEALNKSYQNVLKRLQEAIVKEKRMAILQLQAQFDSLQAQVNPHFLYNVLNVISNRGIISGDETICEICGSLAAMLRYSTNTKERYATICEELNYLEQYFYLLKSRYQHKISFKIQVEEEIGNQIIPKIVLQQIVENCINHGFENSTKEMKIEITGWKEKNHWYIKVHDNGQGFKPGVINKLNEKLEQIKNRIEFEKTSVELEIGGMGLINTYARLFLFYNDDLSFSLGNSEEGANVIIGSVIQEEREKIGVYGYRS